MTTSYVSVYFEKTDLYTEIGQQRCIVRNLDDGPVPPTPSPSYFPTEPDSLRACMLIEYVNATLGERFLRIAALSDIDIISVNRLIDFVATGVDFTSVLPGDLLYVQIPHPAEWTSEEYPSSTFAFEVAAVMSPTRLRVVTPFPSFKTGLSWSVPARSLSGTYTGATQREVQPSPGQWLRDTRFNILWPSVPQLDAFVASTKAQLDELGQSATSTNLVSERYTSRPRIRY